MSWAEGGLAVEVEKGGRVGHLEQWQLSGMPFPLHVGQTSGTGTYAAVAV